MRIFVLTYDLNHTLLYKGEKHIGPVSYDYGNKPCKKGGYACIKSITPQMIIDKVEELLA